MVNAHVHTEHHVGGDNLRRLHHVVDIEAHVVGAAVPHIAAHVLHVVQHPRVLQPRGVVAADLAIHLGHGHTGPDQPEHMVGGGQGAFVQQALALAVPAVAGPAPGHVGHEIIVPRPHVVEHHVAVLGLPGVGIVVDAEIVPARRDNGREGRALGAVLAQGVVEHRLVLVLVHTGPGRLHHGGDARAGDLFRLPHGLDFAGLLDGAQAADQGVGVLDLQKRVVGGRPLQQAVGGGVPVGGIRPVEIQVQVLVIALGGQLVELPSQLRREAHLPDA